MASRTADPSGSCAECGRPTFGGATHCKARLCPHYAPIWARDQQRKVFENLDAYAARPGDGHVGMITVTAPGKCDLPWDEDHCRGLGGHDHSGLLGCRVRADVAAEWNSTASARWRRLHSRASRLTRQEVGARSLAVLVRTFEQQTRGVLHVHVVVGRRSWQEKRAADVYAKHLARLAEHYGFGSVDAPSDRARPAREAAAYVSSYLTRGKGHKRSLSETVRSDQLPSSIIHVSVDLTQATGVTMRSLRFRRLVWVAWRVVLPFPEQRQLLQLLDAFPGSELVRGPPVV